MAFLEASSEDALAGLGLEGASLKLGAMERGDLVLEHVGYSAPEDVTMIA